MLPAEEAEWKMKRSLLYPPTVVVIIMIRNGMCLAFEIMTLIVKGGALLLQPATVINREIQGDDSVILRFVTQNFSAHNLRM